MAKAKKPAASLFDKEEQEEKTTKKPAAKKPAAKKPAAKAPAKKPAAKKPAAEKSPAAPVEENKQVISWEDEMARDAQIAAEKEASSAGGQFFSTAGGVLKFDDVEIPGNKMLVVILGSIFENVYYEGEYDRDNITPPTCFAFAEYEGDLTPHKDVVEAGQSQTNDNCKSCEHNQWGSAERGRGKACTNRRRLGLITAGEYDKKGEVVTLFDDPSHFEKTPMGFLKIPPTSVKGFASFVKQVSSSLKRPPYGIVTEISIVPDPKLQFKVVFTPIEKISNELGNMVMKRREECLALIDSPYDLEHEEDERPAPRSRAAKKPRTRKKY